MGSHRERQKKRKKTPVVQQKQSAPGRPNKKGGTGSKRFQRNQLLGVGGMCEVYSALDLCRLEWSDAFPKVAVKRLLPELAHNRQAQVALAQEFFTLRHLVHPGVVRVYELHTEPDGLCYTMELLGGTSLHHMQADAPSGLGREGMKLAAQLFETLAYLHEKGVVHADVKPANLFRAPGDRLVLIDFNISQVTSRPGAACSPIAHGLRTSLKFPAHSLLHSSPDRLKTGRPSVADDIFAACCTVYEVIAGEHPFKRLSSLEAEKKALLPQRPKGIPGCQWKMLRRGLSFAPADRPKASQLQRAFKASSLFSKLSLSLFG